MSVNRTEQDWQKTIETVAEQSRAKSVSNSLQFALLLICLSGAAIGVMYLVPTITPHMQPINLIFLKVICGSLAVLTGGNAIGWAIRAIWAKYSPHAKEEYRKDTEKEFSTANTLETIKTLKEQNTYEHYAHKYHFDSQWDSGNEDDIFYVDTAKRHFSKLVNEGYISKEAETAIMEYIKLKRDLIDLKKQEKVNPVIVVLKQNTEYAWNDETEAQIETADEQTMALKGEIAAKKEEIATQFKLILNLFDIGHLALPNGAVGYALRPVTG